MTAKSDLLIEELVSAAVAFGREKEPDWQTRIEKARSELKAYVAEIELAQRWIPVSEKPLEAGTFFVLLKNGEVTKDFTFIDGGRYYWWNHGANITHWMPLPKLPEVQE